MQNSKQYLKHVFLAVSFSSLAACGGVRPVQIQKEYATIPKSFEVVPRITPIPREETITVGDALTIANRLRSDACIMRSRYKELLRYASFGEQILADPDNSECPVQQYSPLR